MAIRCPQCEQVVDLAPGPKPRCPRCGYMGGPVRQVGVPTGQPPRAPATRPATSRPRRLPTSWKALTKGQKIGVVVGAVAILAIIGAFAGGGAPAADDSPAPPRSTAADTAAADARWLRDFLFWVDSSDGAFRREMTKAGQAIEDGDYDVAKVAMQEGRKDAQGGMYTVEEEYQDPPAAYQEGWALARTLFREEYNFADEGVKCVRDAEQGTDTGACEAVAGPRKEALEAAQNDFVAWRVANAPDS